jgi:hypothetical protein
MYHRTLSNAIVNTCTQTNRMHISPDSGRHKIQEKREKGRKGRKEKKVRKEEREGQHYLRVFHLIS